MSLGISVMASTEQQGSRLILCCRGKGATTYLKKQALRRVDTPKTKTRVRAPKHRALLLSLEICLVLFLFGFHVFIVLFLRSVGML